MADLHLIKRDPDKGYFGRQLWIPKKHVNVRSIKAGLEFPVVGEEGIDYLQLWEENETHIIVPREFIPRDQYPLLSFPIIQTGPTSFPAVKFKSRIELDKQKPNQDIQRNAFAAMCAARSGILNLKCGAGKTCLALHHMATKGVPALVVVNNTTLIDQWQYRIDQFLDVEGGVGLVQGPPDKWDWEGRGIVLAMIHSLSLRYEELPEGFDRYFGEVYYDEVHHLSAPLFVHTAPMFYGARYGLTATVGREDGLEPIYQYHIGPVFFRYLMQDLKPRIYIQEMPTHINFQDPAVKKEVSDCKGMPNIPKLRGYLCTRPETNQFIANKLQVPLQKGRKVLALSHCVEQLVALNAMFPDSGLCIGDVKPHERIETLRHKQITFGTLQLVKEALDEETLDTIFFLTPFGSGAVEMGGKNSLQQGMGRILRPLEGKKHPVVVILDPIYIPKLHRMCGQLKRLINAWPRDEGGPFEYTILSPYEEKEPNEPRRQTTDHTGYGNLQQMYIGYTILPHEHILRMMKEGTPIGLTETRIFQHLILTMMTPQGPATSVNTKIVPFPIDMNGGEIWIKATEYIDPNSSTALSKAINEIMATCNHIEQETRARDSGLVLASSMPKD